MHSRTLMAGARGCAATLARRQYAAGAAGAAEPRAERAGARQSNSFMLNMFRGDVQPADLFPFPDPLRGEQRQALAELLPHVERFFQEVNDPARNDADSAIEPATLAGLWELGAFGLQVPAELGGLGLCNTQYARMVEVVGAHDLGVGITLGAHQSIGFKGILLFGTPEQKQKYLPRVTSGQFAAFALTEPSSGSDASSIKTRGELSADGKHWVLNGSKIWISNGGFAEIMTVFAQTPVQKDGKTVDKVTAFIVERAFGGVSSGAPEKKMGIRCSNTAEVYLEDVRVPVENVLGGVGQGFKVAMNILNNGRFGMAAALAGTQRAAIATAAAHAATRTQFGRRLQDFPAVQARLGSMAARHYATETLAYAVAGAMDAGATEYQLEAAAAKVFASEAAWQTVDDAIQLLGGMGFMRAAGLERVLRDLRIFRIFEGTNDILRLFIALTGIQFAGSALQELQRAFKSPTANLGLIFSAAGRRAGRAVGLPPTDTLGARVPGSLRAEAAELARGVAALGAAVEAALRAHGKGVVEQQLLLHELAEAALALYSSAAVMSRAARAGADAGEAELAAAWCADALPRARVAAEAARGGRLDAARRAAALGLQVAERGGQVVPNPLKL